MFDLFISSISAMRCAKEAVVFVLLMNDKVNYYFQLNLVWHTTNSVSWQ